MMVNVNVKYFSKRNDGEIKSQVGSNYEIEWEHLFGNSRGIESLSVIEENSRDIASLNPVDNSGGEVDEVNNMLASSDKVISRRLRANEGIIEILRSRIDNLINKDVVLQETLSKLLQDYHTLMDRISHFESIDPVQTSGLRIFGGIIISDVNDERIAQLETNQQVSIIELRRRLLNMFGLGVGTSFSGSLYILKHLRR